MIENGEETQRVTVNNYTCIDFRTLQPYMPDMDTTDKGIVRDYPNSPLVRRTPAEIQELSTHLFFTQR